MEHGVQFIMLFYGQKDDAQNFVHDLNAARADLKGAPQSLHAYGAPPPPHGQTVTPTGMVSFRNHYFSKDEEYRLAEKISKAFPDIIVNFMIVDDSVAEASSFIMNSGDAEPSHLGGSVRSPVCGAVCRATIRGEDFLKAYGPDKNIGRVQSILEEKGAQAISSAINLARIRKIHAGWETYSGSPERNLFTRLHLEAVKHSIIFPSVEDRLSPIIAEIINVASSKGYADADSHLSSLSSPDMSPDYAAALAEQYEDDPDQDYSALVAQSLQAVQEDAHALPASALLRDLGGKIADARLKGKEMREEQEPKPEMDLSL
ncbi:hypothetical protein [Acetobacter persici]|uniref:Uncharacterized protein n=1 Tax=Acetobacter persici TaxID=1076596 RepID=A0A1U9LIJ4_9PROT|nr:hypothetical protein [Acetobacter persici]AQT06285.1 hypothetical protein A0U91_14760 [Acetobacter persici]